MVFSSEKRASWTTHALTLYFNKFRMPGPKQRDSESMVPRISSSSQTHLEEIHWEYSQRTIHIYLICPFHFNKTLNQFLLQRIYCSPSQADIKPRQKSLELVGVVGKGFKTADSVLCRISMECPPSSKDHQMLSSTAQNVSSISHNCLRREKWKEVMKLKNSNCFDPTGRSRYLPVPI